MSRRVATNLERIQFHHGNLLSFIQSVSLQSVFFKKKKTGPRGTWRRARQGEGAGRKRITLLLPLPYFDASTFPLDSLFDSPQLSVGLNVQIVRSAKYACFAG